MTKKSKYALFWLVSFCIFLSWVIFWPDYYGGGKKKSKDSEIRYPLFRNLEPADSAMVNIDSSSFYATDSNGSLRIIDDIDTFQGINDSSGLGNLRTSDWTTTKLPIIEKGVWPKDASTKALPEWHEVEEETGTGTIGGGGIGTRDSIKEYWVHGKKPENQHDTSYLDYNVDTLFGRIEFNSGHGVIRGKGMVVKGTVYRMSEKTPPTGSSYGVRENIITGRIDTIGWGGGGSIGIGEKFEEAYIKTKNGYKQISEKFTFIPY